MRTAEASGTWERIPVDYAYMIRWNRTVNTPDWAREERHLIGATWTSPTHDQRVIVTFPIGNKGRPFLGISHNPWSRTDRYEVSLDRALAALNDPAAVLDPAPQHSAQPGTDAAASDPGTVAT
jgi:hypothetical protein